MAKAFTDKTIKLKKITFTDNTIKNLKPNPARPREVPAGARGLYVWVGMNGLKSFIVRFRNSAGVPKKITLGRWVPPEDREADYASPPTAPVIGGPMSLASARKLAGDVFLALANGQDPAADRKRDKREQRQEAAETFEVVSTQYMRLDGSKLRSADNLDRMLRTRILPTLGSIPILQLKKSDIVALLDTLENEYGAVTADRCLALTRRILHFYAERSDDYRPPLLRFKPRGSEEARDRTLSDDEIRAVWQASGEMEGPFGPFVRFLLLTACRRNEAALMTWAEIKGTDWVLPASRNKAAARSKKVKDLTRPLSAAAQAILAEQPKVNEFVFTYGKGGLSGFSKPKRQLDAIIAEQARQAGELPIPIPNWTLHDLRRTSASLMERVEVPSEHIAACLGHVKPGVTGKHYLKHKHHAQMARAYELLSAEIARILNPPSGDNVVPFKAAGEGE
jgi:integrase